MNVKQRGAMAALAYIKEGMIVGLGGGRTIAYLAQFLADKQLQVNVVTPSFETEKLCVELGLHVLPLRMVHHVDIAFDGCDEVDHDLFALKSGGGIHTKEKLIANMADEYMLIVDESKVSKHLTFACPIVVELLEDALAYVQQQVNDMQGTFQIRTSDGKYGPLLSDYGNVLADVRFDRMDDIRKLNHSIKKIAGVIDTSLLTREVTSVLVVTNDGHYILKNEEKKI